MGKKGIALNRTYALYKTSYAETAIKEAKKLNLEDSIWYHQLMAELYIKIDKEQAVSHLKGASQLTNNPYELKFINEKLNRITKD